MRSLLVILTLLVAFSGCVKKNKVPTTQNQTQAMPGMHEVKVAEVIQSSQYTYLRVTENGADNWIAVTRQEAAAGETYYYADALEMKNFESKELKRTFETIYFVQELSKQPHSAEPAALPNPHGNTLGKVSVEQKSGISVAPAQDGLTIAKLYGAKADYAGKKIKMKGQVVKVNNEVMGKNWVHIQDGTNDGDHFDLTITTMDKVDMNVVVTFEGTIAVNKDFGYGYSYELIMEDATLIK